MMRNAIVIMLCLIFGQVSLAATNNRPRPANNPQSQTGGHEAYFRCRDENGNQHFGDSMPQECLGMDTEVLSDRGNVVRVIDGAKTAAEKASQKSVEDTERKAKNDAEMRDHMLLDTYLSVADIERLRDQRIDQVQGQLMIDQQTLTALMDREKAVLTQVQNFRPYNPAPNARGIPDNTVVDMVSIADNLRITLDRIASKKTEMQDLQAKFTSDILRFKELKGLK